MKYSLPLYRGEMGGGRALIRYSQRFNLFLSPARVLHHQHCGITTGAQTPGAADPNTEVKASPFQCGPAVVTARVWFVAAGRQRRVFPESPGKFSSDDGGGGLNA